MQPQEKQQLASFGADARRRVAEQVKCNVSAVCQEAACQRIWAVTVPTVTVLPFCDIQNRSSETLRVQVDDCIAKFLYMKSMTGKVKQLKAEGKAMPKDYQQLEKEFGECAHACFCNVST